MSAEGPESSASTSFDQRQDLLADIARFLPETLVVLDADGTVLWANEVAKSFFGSALEEVIGRSALEFIHPDDIELTLRSLDSVQNKDVGTLIELRLKTAEGWKLAEVIGRRAALLSEANIVFCIRDVTERRRFEVARDDVAKFRSLVQNAAYVTMLVSKDGIVESVSAALTRLFSHDPESVEGRPLVQLFAAADHAVLDQTFESAPNTVGPATCEAHLLGFGQSGTIPVELSIVSLLDDPTVGGFVVTMRDVTERALAEKQMRQTLSLLSATLESTADGILVVDRDGRIISYNHRFAELWRIPEEILIARDDQRAIAYVTEQLESPEEFLAKIAELYSSPEEESFDTFRFRDGQVFERYSLPQRVGDEIVGRVWSFRDVTDRKALEESLSHRAFHDALTGLANQSLFLERLEQATHSSDIASIVAVLFVDVDGLKLANDRFGHIVGDRLLVQVADVLRASVGASCTLARLGGDEFGVLAENLGDQADAVALAERILDGLAQVTRFSASSIPVEVSLSIGIAFYEPSLSYLEVLHNADVAMYSAKQHGRARWEVYSDASAIGLA